MSVEQIYLVLLAASLWLSACTTFLYVHHQRQVRALRDAYDRERAAIRRGVDKQDQDRILFYVFALVLAILAIGAVVALVVMGAI